MNEITASLPKGRVKKSKKKMSLLKRQQMIWGYILIAPLLSGLLLFYIFPFFQNIYYSFAEFGAFGRYEITGLNNYRKLIGDRELRQAFFNTFKYVLITVPIGVSISTVIAALLNSKIRGKGFYRVMYFLPAVAMSSAISSVWKWMFNRDYGILNQILAAFGGEPQSWLNDPKYSLIAVSIVMIWSKVGYNMIILLAGLQGIPKSLYEAAEIDGAGPIRKFFSVTLPLLTPSLFFVSIITLIGAFQTFDIIFMMVNRGSMAINSSMSVVYLFYENAFVTNQKGYAAAISVVLFIVIMLITAVQLKLQKKWVNY